MGATTHKRWRKARVLDVCDVAQHVRQIVLEPERLEAPAPPGSHIDIGVYVNGRADIRSYSVVGMGTYGNELMLGVQLARHSRCRTSRSTTASRATCWPRAASASPHWSPWARRSRPAVRTTASSTARAPA